MHMVNDKGEAVYYNLVRKNNKDYWLVQGIGSTVVYGRDRERRKSRHFTQEQQAERYLARGMVSGPIDRHFFSGGKNTKEKHPHERTAH